MRELGLRFDAVLAWACVAGVVGFGACGGGEPAKGSGVIGAGGSGGGSGGSGGGAPVCFNLCQPGEFQVTTRLDGDCVVHCGSSRSSTASGSSEHRGDFEDGGELYIKATSGDAGADAGVGADAGSSSSSVEYALVRMPEGGPLAGHWICAESGAVAPPAAGSTAQSYSLSQLSDLGPCAGDPASSDTLSVSQAIGSSSTVTGTISGMAIANSTTSSSCSPYRCEFAMSRQAGQTAGYLALRVDEGATVVGEAAPLSEGAWVAPSHLGYDLICAGEGSTVTRTGDSAYQVELRGLRKLTCPGTPVAGTVDGVLTASSASAGGS